ncbi:MAG: glycosyltransferase family 2 protein [bacterium]
MSDVRRTSAAPDEPLSPLAVVVVNWNGRDVLSDCFRSLQDENYPDLHVIMVDNGSTDDSVAYTRKHHRHVEILEAGRNLRWAAGNNLALMHLRRVGFRGCVLLLNNDTIVPEGSLRALVKGFQASPAAWAATPRICYADDPSRAWYDGGVIGRWSGWVKHAGIRRVAGDLSLQPRFVDYGTGCALLLGPVALERVGLLDEGFFFYGEDADYSIRIRARGGRIIHVPRALVLHKVSVSVGEYSPLKMWMRSRSHVKLLRKHWPWWSWPLLAVSQAAYLTGHAAYHLWQGRPAVALAVWEGALDELRGSPHPE